MSDYGWIKVHRKILDNPVVNVDSDYFAVWMYLLLNATHKDIPAWFGGKKITLKSGQLITGRKAISKALRVNESKVYRILSVYKSEHQIEQLTSARNSLITIVNWQEYQNCEQLNEQQMNNRRTTDEQQMNTNKNNKNNKNKRNNTVSFVGRNYDFDDLENQYVYKG